MKCRTCGTNINRDNVAHEKWRLYRRGYGRKQANAILPRCHPCMSQWLEANHRDFDRASVNVLVTR